MRKAPPNQAITIWELINIFQYCVGLSIASLNACTGSILANIETNKIGNNSLIPNTATIIHHVINLFCHKLLMSFNTLIFTIILSKDNEDSSIHKKNTTNTADSHIYTVPVSIYQIKNQNISDAIVKINDQRKYFLNVFMCFYI